MLKHLLFQMVDWYRPPVEVDATNTEFLGDDALVARRVAVNIQPASVRQIEFMMAFRSQEVSHNIYTDHPGPWQRNDVLVYDGRRFTVIGVRNQIELGRLWVLDALEYVGANPRR